MLGRVAERFDVGAPGADPSPPGRHALSMYLEGSWRALVPHAARIDESDPVASLDAAILQAELLAPVLGIENPRTDERIAFVGGIRGTSELAARVDRQAGGVAFSLYPTSIEELLAVADAGRVMPPKSTWFEPKLQSGLVVHPLDD